MLAGLTYGSVQVGNVASMGLGAGLVVKGGDGDRLDDATVVSDGLAICDGVREELAWPVPGFSLPHADMAIAPRSMRANPT
jgi:hypothetical protein